MSSNSQYIEETSRHEIGSSGSAHSFPYEQVIAYAFGDLDETGSAMVLAHADHCEQCAKTIERYQWIRATVSQDDSLLPPLSTLARAQKIFGQNAPRPSKWRWEILRRAVHFNSHFAFVMGMIALIVTNLLLLGGMGALTAAAQAALPGDILYPAKMAFEQVQLTLSFGSAAQAQRHLEFAHNRVDEIRALADMGREIEIPVLVRSFQNILDQLSLAIDTLEKQDPVTARGLEQKAIDAMGQYATSLAALKGTGLVLVGPMVEPAIKACETKKSGFQKRLDKQLPPRSSPTPTTSRMRIQTPVPSRSPSSPIKTLGSTNALPEPSRPRVN